MSAQFAGRLLLALTAAGLGNAFVRGAAEPKVVKLPATAQRSVIAGDGRFLALHLPTAKQIVVLDVKEAKVVKSLPAPDDDILLAGGLDYLFVVRKPSSTMQRWSLATFEKEATVRLPMMEVPFENVCMGCASNGPMLLCSSGDSRDGGKLTLLNPVTVRELPTTGWLPTVAYNTISASSDGQIFAYPSTGLGGTVVMRSVDGKFAAKALAGKDSGLRPGPGGRFFYNGSRVYDEEGRPVHPRLPAASSTWNISAVQGPVFLELEQIARDPMSGWHGWGKARVFLEGQFEPVATTESLDKFNTSSFTPYLIPRFNRLIFCGKDNDEVILFPFDLDALLAASEVNYLAVMSTPPPEVSAGKRFEYTPVVKSKKGGVKITLEAGPDGMKVGTGGKLMWDVPAALAKQEVVVILSVSDSSGRDMFHTFRLAVVTPPVEKP